MLQVCTFITDRCMIKIHRRTQNVRGVVTPMHIFAASVRRYTERHAMTALLNYTYSPQQEDESDDDKGLTLLQFPNDLSQDSERVTYTIDHGGGDIERVSYKQPILTDFPETVVIEYIGTMNMMHSGSEKWVKFLREFMDCGGQVHVVYHVPNEFDDVSDAFASWLVEQKIATSFECVHAGGSKASSRSQSDMYDVAHRANRYPQDCVYVSSDAVTIENAARAGYMAVLNDPDCHVVESMYVMTGLE